MTEIKSPIARRRKVEPALPALEPFSVPGAYVEDSMSRRNFTRRKRDSTKYIILHTTEGGLAGSMERIKKIGAVHFTIAENGTIFRTLDEKRVGNHTGRAQWDGDTAIDNKSIGIEMVGCSRTQITKAQEVALARLLAALKKKYHVKDERIIPHAMIAYQWNPFEKLYVRGRREDAVQFAQPEMRRRLGLRSFPKLDPEVRDGELSVVNRALERDLFHYPGAKQILYPPRQRVGACPTPEYPRAEILAANRGARYTPKPPTESEREQPAPPTEAARLPTPQSEERTDDLRNGFLTVGVDGRTAYSLAGKFYKHKTTHYLFPSGLVRRGDEIDDALLDHLPLGTRVLVGYQYGGKVASDRSAMSIARKKWSDPTTFYVVRKPAGNNTFRFQITNGAEMDESAIQPGTHVFYEAWKQD